MTFSRRLRLYIFGVLLGLLISFAFFNKRMSVLTSWFPNNRVLQNLQHGSILTSTKANCQLDCLSLSEKDIDYLSKEGDVQFNLSKTRQDPQVYVIDAEPDKEEPFRMTFEIRDSVSTLIDVELPGKKINCNCE